LATENTLFSLTVEHATDVAEDTVDSAEDLLDDMQTRLERESEAVEALTGVDRREFVFMSLVAAAATTFGVPLARAQVGTSAPQQPAAPAIDLGNGEPPATVFQAYPGGTGALMEKLAKERGRAAFDRAAFTVAKWSGPIPTSDDEIAFLPAHRLSALIKERKITSARLTDIYLARIKRLDPTLLCAVTIMEEPARAAARRADAEIAAGKYRGPLHGVPWGVKDLFSTKGTRTTWGSRDFENRIIDEDAEVVVRLHDAGAVLMAKLATGLFANNDWWYRGRTNNPWDIRRGSSGSSAGPSSATAAGCVAFAIGTETGGSIVSPARECGLSALRPTFGRVSRYGAMTLSWSRDRVGPICRTIEDCAMVFNTIHGVDEKDPSTLMMPFHFDRDIKLSSVRIGVDPGAPKGFVDKLRELGADPKPIGPRPQLGGGRGGGGGGGGETAAAFDSYVQMKAKELGVDLASLPTLTGRGGAGGGADSTAGRGGRGGGGRGAGGIPGDPTGMASLTSRAGGRTALALDFIQAERRQHILMLRMAEFMKDWDMYVPTETNGDVGLHAQTGHPCAVVPYKFESPTTPVNGAVMGPGVDSAGVAGGPDVHYNPKPICAVLAGGLFNDDKILSVAHQFQIHTDWHTRHPSL
jgi:Asp-tRNA(Asn)/Glu-tRNA(Gln) amidotransferase A subunit family amidase